MAIELFEFHWVAYSDTSTGDKPDAYVKLREREPDGFGRPQPPSDAIPIAIATEMGYGLSEVGASINEKALTEVEVSRALIKLQTAAISDRDAKIDELEAWKAEHEALHARLRAGA